jgi:hypothetical protein
MPNNQTSSVALDNIEKAQQSLRALDKKRTEKKAPPRHYGKTEYNTAIQSQGKSMFLSSYQMRILAINEHGTSIEDAPVLGDIKTMLSNNKQIKGIFRPVDQCGDQPDPWYQTDYWMSLCS